MGEHIITEIIKTIVTLDTIELPENPTNGDMVKAIFNVEVVDDFCKSVGIKLNDSNYVQFNKDWWNAPYKKGATR